MMAKTLIQSSRPPFLVLTPACVFLGVSFAVHQGFQLQILPLCLLLVGALMAHVSVNTFNEYLDFSSGLDLNTQRTPFSGGSGALPNNPGAAKAVLGLAVTSLLFTVLIGVYFVFLLGLPLLTLGLVGVALVVFYTRLVNRLPWLCLFAPGIGFGLLMVSGSYIVVSGGFIPQVYVLSLVPFFLVNNLLLLNQYPDIDADREAGRNHFPIRYGIAASNRVYAVFLFAAVLLVVILVSSKTVPAWALIALAPLAMGGYALTGAMRYGRHIAKHPPYMGMNVAAAVLTPFLLGLVILIGA